LDFQSRRGTSSLKCSGYLFPLISLVPAPWV
jgi:hypothetical protein